MRTAYVLHKDAETQEHPATEGYKVAIAYLQNTPTPDEDIRSKRMPVTFRNIWIVGTERIAKPIV